jgi:hypothetical protein
MLNILDHYPSWVCFDCGRLANHLHRLKQYGAMAKVECNQGAMAVHEDNCDCCGVKKTVTSPRDFFYPDHRAFKYVHRYVTQGVLK